MSKKEKKEKEKGIGIVRFWAWNFRGMSVAVQVVLIGYITFYCTDVLGLNAALVATLLMATKLFDGVTDVFAGYLVDITKTKWGKARPYEFSIIGLWLATWAMFSVPVELQTVAKCAWVVICYTLAQSVFCTLLNANGTAYMVRAFNKQEHYVKLSSLGGLCTVTGVAVFNVTFPSMMAQAGTDAGAWSSMVMKIAIPLAIIGMMRFLFVPEKYEVDAKGESINLKEVKILLTNNKYIYIIALVGLASNLVGALGVSVYYFTYIVGDVSLMGIMSFFTIVAMLTMVFYPVVLKRMSIKRFCQLGCFIYMVGGIVLFFAGSDVMLLGVGNIILGIGTLPVSMISGLMIVECADFNEWEGRPRMEGTLGSVNGLAVKIGSALGTLVSGVLLSASGYVGGAEVLPDSALLMIRLLYSLIPAALYMLVAVILNFYKLDKQIDQIRKENEERRAAAAGNATTVEG